MGMCTDAAGAAERERNTMGKGIVIGVVIGLFAAVVGCSSEPAAGDGSDEATADESSALTYPGHCYVDAATRLTTGYCMYESNSSLICLNKLNSACPVGAAAITFVNDIRAICPYHVWDGARTCSVVK